MTAPAPKRNPGDIVEVEVAKGTKISFCWIPAGEAQLGSTAEERALCIEKHKERQNKSPVDESEIVRGKYKTKGFWLGKHLVTQSEWEAVMANNPSYFSQAGKGAARVAEVNTRRLPVEMVSWDDCQAFLKRLNETANRPEAIGKGAFSLPHEDQWEYACRGGKGNKQAFYFGNDLDGRLANVDGERPYGPAKKGPALDRTTEVGAYEKIAKHPWGLCDMCGNVSQWCDNSLEDRLRFRAVRGGAWGYPCSFARSARRGALPESIRIETVGLRILVQP